MREICVRAATGRKPRNLACHGHRVQGQVHVKTLYGGANVGLLYRVQRTGVAGYAKLEPTKGVPGEPTAGQRDVLGAGEPIHRQLHQGGRGGRPGVGGRHDHMENNRPEQHTVRAHHIHRIVERPQPQAQAVYADPDHRRVPHQHRSAVLYLLFLRAAHGSGWTGRVRAAGHDRRMDDHVHGCVQLRGRRDDGECVETRTEPLGYRSRV